MSQYNTFWKQKRRGTKNCNKNMFLISSFLFSWEGHMTELSTANQFWCICIITVNILSLQTNLFECLFSFAYRSPAIGDGELRWGFLPLHAGCDTPHPSTRTYIITIPLWDSTVSCLITLREKKRTSVVPLRVLLSLHVPITPYSFNETPY